MSASADVDEQEQGVKLHMGIAEQGKVYALTGNHKMALAYYRHAMHMTVKGEDSDVFFRHYLECIIESLEHMGAFQEVLEFCEKALDFYNDSPPSNRFSQKDLGHVYERQGVVLFKLGRKEEAEAAFERALDVMKKADVSSPLVKNLLRWIKTGMHVDTRRILAEQERAKYFSVRKETVDPSRAIKLPDEKLLGPSAVSF